MNLIERVVGKFLIALNKRTYEEMRRARECRYHAQYEIPQDSSQVELVYAGTKFLKVFSDYYQSKGLIPA